MKQLNRLSSSFGLPRMRAAFFAGLAALVVAAVCNLPPPSRAEAGDEIRDRGQIGELDQLLADFHGALSYGGDINAMMKLWAENSSITFNGTPHVGNAAIRSFFTSGGYFLNNWVSLAPEFKTQITVSGNKAQATTQCVATDISVTPFVVRNVVQVSATMERQRGKWLFTSMNNTTPAPL